MKKNVCLLYKFSILFITVVLGFTAQTSHASLTPQQLQRINNVADIHKRHVTQLMENRDVIASGIGLDARGEPVIKVLVTNTATAVPDRVDGVRVHKEMSTRIFASRGLTCEVSGNNICFHRGTLAITGSYRGFSWSPGSNCRHNWCSSNRWQQRFHTK